MKYTILMTISLFFCFSGCSKRPSKAYVAAPDFSESNFSKIQTGMALHEVLNILGPPLSIFGPIEGNREYRLEYTGPTSTTLLQIADKENKQIKFHSYSIRFDAGDHVIKMHSNDVMCAPYQGMEEAISANENYRRTIGKLTLQSPSGVSTVLDSNDLGLYLIVLVQDGCNSSSCSVNGGPSWLRLAAQDMIDNGIVEGRKYLYIGDQPQSFTDSLKLIEESQAGKCFVQTEPAIKLTTRDRDSGILLYKSGTIHSVPSVGFAPDENNQPVPYKVEIEIQKWLINNLGSNKSLQ